MKPVSVDHCQEYILAFRAARCTTIFRVTFERRCKERDGVILGNARTMRCRFWCHALEGHTRPQWTPGKRRLVLVYDMEKKAPRYINLEGVMEIRVERGQMETDHVLGTLTIPPVGRRFLKYV